MDIDIGFLIFVILGVISIVAAVVVAKRFNKKPRKALTVMVGANIVLDVVAATIWILFPDFRWSTYNLDFMVVSIEALVAAGLFAVTLFGLRKTKRWAPALAIAVTIFQRVFANYVFFLSIMNVMTLVWSLLIIYFAYLAIKNPNGQTS